METIVEMLRHRAATHPERAALRCGDQCVTFGALWNHVEAAACYLSNIGVRQGQRVLLAAPSMPAFVYGYFATHLLGAIAVPIDARAPFPYREELIRRTQPVVEFGIDSSSQATAMCPWTSIHELDIQLPQHGRFNAPALDSVADLIFTTGTTGRPKGVPLSHLNLAAAASHIRAVIGVKDGDVNLIPIPLYHAFGLGNLRCFLVSGATVVLVDGFRLPGEIFTAINRHAATGLIGVPAGFAVLLRFGERGLGVFSNQLRYVEIGSAPMPLEHKRMLMKLLPHTSIFMHYGLTEAARSAFIKFHSHSEHLDTAGMAAPNVRIEIRDEQGKPCRPGTSGSLWINGAHVASSYWDDPDLSAATFVNGWMRTGDFADIDENGYIRLRGRQDDLVNIGGTKVSPDEVERALEEHPSISEAGCVGVADPRGITGQVLQAFLVAAEGQTLPSDSELSRWVAQKLGAFKAPARYDWISRLPRTASGKLKRAVLRERNAQDSS